MPKVRTFYTTDQKGSVDKEERRLEVEKPFQCTECDLRFTTNAARNIHGKVHKTRELFVCKECHFKTKDFVSFRKHRLDKCVPQHKCHKCEKMFKSSNKLNSHMFKAHSSEVHQCSKCDFKTNYAVGLEKHRARKHPSENLDIACVDCKYTCRSKSQIKKHMEEKHTFENYNSVHRDDPHNDIYTCPLCDHLDTDYYNMEMHIQGVHGVNKPFSCTECDFESYNNVELELHMSEHGEVTCSQCKYTGSPKELKTHMENHNTIVKNSDCFSCTLCDFTSTSNEDIENHVFKVHNKDVGFTKAVSQLNSGNNSNISKRARKPKTKNFLTSKKWFEDVTKDKIRAEWKRQSISSKDDFLKTQGIYCKCPICGEYFVSKRGIKMHMIMKHEKHKLHKLHKCKECRYPFKTAEGLKNHINNVHSSTQIFSCQKCDYKCSTVMDLRRHISVHEPKRQFSCPECESSYDDKADLTSHMLSMNHSGDKPYSCTKCKAQFLTIVGRNIHMDSHGSGTPYRENPLEDPEHLFSKKNVCGTKSVDGPEYIDNSEYVGDPASIDDTDCVDNPEVINVRKVDRSGKLISCRTCGTAFHYYHQLLNHLKIGTCKKVIEKKADFVEHIHLINQKSKCVVCLFCKVTFNSELQVRKHISYHHSSIVIQIVNLQEHKLIDSITSMYCSTDSNDNSSAMRDKCNLCGMRYSNEIMVREHISQHHSRIVLEKVNQQKNKTLDSLIHTFYSSAPENDSMTMVDECYICGMKNNNKDELKQHLLSHTEKELCCNECGISLKVAKVMYLNKNVPEFLKFNKILKCPLCNFGVCDANCFINHLSHKHSTSTSLNPANNLITSSYICVICATSYNNKDYHEKHMASHSNTKLFLCIGCEYTVRCQAELRRHMKSCAIAHLNVFHKSVDVKLQQQCDTSKSKERENSCEFTDTAFHMFQCHECYKTFISKEDLKIHLITHENIFTSSSKDLRDKFLSDTEKETEKINELDSNLELTSENKTVKISLKTEQSDITIPGSQVSIKMEPQECDDAMCGTLPLVKQEKLDNVEVRVDDILGTIHSVKQELDDSDIDVKVKTYPFC